ncbi:hypothetical protein [Halocatena marina]|uniref:hypothetical protein n=1 Tax=Halocatena marina TaxID=2934937 RepID=UPI00200E5FDD|nr:hypothetical protein [Halocatena marina]
MGLSAVSYTLVFGDRPQTSVQALVAGLVVVGCAVVMRFVAPSLLLGIEPALLTAAIGFLLAVAVGRYEGGVLVAILAAVIPVFSVAVASTAILAPVTPELAARAMRGALWYSMGVAVFVTGLPGYAVGRISQSDHAFSSLPLNEHLRVDHRHSIPLLVYGLLVVGIVVAWSVLPVSMLPPSAAVAPVSAGAGLITAVFLGYRAQGAPPSVGAGTIGVSAGLRLFTQDAFLAASGGSPFVFAGVILAVGFVAGGLFGLIGYGIGRMLAD